jgi:ribosome maturation protein SDO1
VEKTVNPDTGRPYTHSMLERALRDLHFNLDPKKSAKQQALEVGTRVAAGCVLVIVDG